METAVSEITLVVFTTLAPAGIVALIVMLVELLFSKDVERVKRLGRYLVLPLGLAVVGLIASATHLGTPANALYVLTGIGRSPLSNEVGATVAFFVFAGVYWIYSFGNRPLNAAGKAWIGVTIASALVCLWFISTAYTVASIPTWSLPQAQATLWLDALSSGPVVALFCMLCAKALPSKRKIIALVALAVVAAVVNLIVLFFEYESLAFIQTTATAALGLIPAYEVIMLIFSLFEVLGCAGCWFSLLRDGALEKAISRSPQSMVVMALAALSVCLASFAVRFCFYSMYMTLGV